MSDNANDNHPKHPHLAENEADAVLIDRLPFAGQFLLWGMRTWVSALKSQRDFAELSGDGFARFGLGTAGRTLDEVFQVIAVAASRQIDIRCVKCRYVSEDETLLLETVAAGQEGNLSLAYAGLSELLPPAAVRNAFPSLISLAKLLAHAGLVLAKGQITVGQAVEAADDQATTPRMTGDLAADKSGRRAATRASLLQQAAAKLSSQDMPALVH
ncbi:MAG: hypothetical protein ABWY00_16525 [Dongiaceae bacterium]